MQTDHELGENPHDGLVQTFKSPEMNGDFTVEHALLIGLASFAVHSESVPLHDGSMLRQAVVVRCSQLNTLAEMSNGPDRLGTMGCGSLA